MSPAREDDLVGRRIAGKYEVLSIIGQGAMGVVYKARQVALDKVVALKVLADRLRGDTEFVTRFYTEARAASRLDHVNSARVLDFGEEPDGLLYIAMEFLQGRTLEEVLEREFPLDPERVASIMTQTLSAVGGAHALGILHRDLKPENIIVLEGTDEEGRRIDVVKVCDFGIAKLEGAAEPPVTSDGSEVPAPQKATRAGVIVGTPQYMSPEQARGESLDVRSDIYSLGVVLFELLASRPPFDECTPAQLIHKHAFVEPPTPSSFCASVDPRLEAICLRALRKDRAERFASAREMRAELRAIAQHEPSEVHIEPRSTPNVRIFDAGAPTMQATVSTPGAIKARGARRIWLAVVGLAAVGGAAVAASMHKTLPSTRPVVVTSAPPALVSSAPPLIVAESMTSTAELASATAHVAFRPRSVVRVGKLPSVAAAAEMVAPAETPPRAIAAESQPSASPAPSYTASAAPVRIDPTRAHVDIGRIVPDRVSATSVESAARHVDFTGCYRSSLVRAQSPFSGTATLAIETDEDGNVTSANLTGGDFPASLRQCVAARARGARIPNVDTGAAAAKLTLRFALQ